MARFYKGAELTDAEFSTLRQVATGFTSRAINPTHRARLLEYGLIHEVMGGLMPTPAGRMVAGVK